MNDKKLAPRPAPVAVAAPAPAPVSDAVKRTALMAERQSLDGSLGPIVVTKESLARIEAIDAESIALNAKAQTK